MVLLSRTINLNVIIMIKNWKFVLTIFFAFINIMMVNCQENYIEIDLSGKEMMKSEVLASDIATDISYVVLETKPGTYISRIAKLELAKNRIIILNNTGVKRERILIFDLKGKFVSEIYKIGKGPGEYTGISDFTYNPIGKTIIILDAHLKKVLVYSIEGIFIKEVFLEFRPNNIAFTQPDKIACFIPLQSASRNSKGELVNTIVYDLNFQSPKLIGSPSSNIIHNPYMVTTGGVGNHNGKLSFKPPFDNVIYTLNKNFEYETHCVIDFGKREVPDDLYADMFLMRERGKNYKYLMHTLETKDFFFIKYRYKGEICLYVFNKPKEKLTKLGMEKEGHGIKNDIDGSLRIWPRKVSGQNILISYYDSIDLLEYYNNYGLQEVKAEYDYHRNKLLDIINDLNEESNPVIQIINLK